MPIYEIERLVLSRERIWIEDDTRDEAIGRAYNMREGAMKQREPVKIKKVLGVKDSRNKEKER